MKKIFSVNREKVEEVHAGLRKSPSGTVREEFALGHGVAWGSERNQELYDNKAVLKAIIDDMKTKPDANLKEHGVYDRAELWKKRSIAKRVPMIDQLAPWVLDKSLPKGELEVGDLVTISEICQNSASTLLALKAFTIKSKMEDSFYGYHPQTGPVVEAEMALLGYRPSPREHKEMCEKWAQDSDTNPTKINTLLWVIGMEIIARSDSSWYRGYSQAEKDFAKKIAKAKAKAKAEEEEKKEGACPCQNYPCHEEGACPCEDYTIK